ncbi:MAG TPA: FkbM family methyltransferase [Chryseosolibacter sp.]|nr:FkbM family methyltransferase [Chryseosolibacter sp.]
MFGLIASCLQIFGIRGLFVYLKLKFKSEKISLPGYLHPIHLRPSLTDKITFKEIFLKLEYNVDLPPTLNVQYIIDAGANIGLTSVYLANRFPHARIISIEPDEENFIMLRKNTRAYSNIVPVKSALLNQKEQIDIRDVGLGKRGMMVEKSSTDTGMTSTSISDLMSEFHLPHIDILKMDIEGSEREVFEKNYQDWLTKTNCLIVELHDRMKPGCSTNVFKALSDYRYSFSIRGENLVFITENLM